MADEPLQLSDLIAEMRRRKDRIKGDGFGYVGDLKSAYKKAVRRLEELQHLIDNAPAQQVFDDPNPDCCGHGQDNIIGCECRLICARMNS